jgi:hypothetical protein
MESKEKLAQWKSVSVQFYETSWKMWGKQIVRVDSQMYWQENNKIKE